jgi:ABC-type transporter Mla MlaB component
MIYIQEMSLNEDAVTIRVDGILDRQTIPELKRVYQRHLKMKKKVLLHLEGLIHISREGRNFLQEAKKKVTIINPPQFFQFQK